MLFSQYIKTSRLRSLSAIGLVLTALTTAVYANPHGGTVTAGDATIKHNKTNTYIQQSSKQAVIDWKTFNVEKNEHTHFQVPTSTSSTLNRVNGKYGASKIHGKITSNGNLFLINPAGILFSRTAKVDVAGLIATTANISNTDFMDSRYNFQQVSGFSQGEIINKGNIRIKDTGLAALVAPGVENSGVIEAKLGKVALGAGSSFTLDLFGDDLIHFAVINDVKDDKSMSYAVNDIGSIIADSVRIRMSAQTVGDVVKGVINTDGYTQANTVEKKGDKIVLGFSNGSIIALDTPKLEKTQDRKKVVTNKTLTKLIAVHDVGPRKDSFRRQPASVVGSHVSRNIDEQSLQVTQEEADKENMSTSVVSSSCELNTSVATVDAAGNQIQTQANLVCKTQHNISN